MANNGMLGCSYCRDFSVANACNPATRRLSNEWISNEVKLYGKQRSEQLNSLRKKISNHKSSEAHTSAEKFVELSKKGLIEELLSAQSSDELDETCKVFRTAYYIGKADRPYTDHPELIELQKLNGVNVGRVLHSNVTCSDIIDHISKEMKLKLLNQILEKECKFAILIDESTSVSKLSCLIVYLRTALALTSDPITFFLDIVELPSNSAEDIEQSLLLVLDMYGFTDDILAHRWVGLGVDGASVMLGKKSGVATRLKQKYRQIVSWHCFNHRLELAVSDAAKACTEVNPFKMFLDTLYALYSASPKLSRELEAVASQLSVQLHKIGRILDTRWCASSLRTIKAV